MDSQQALLIQISTDDLSKNKEQNVDDQFICFCKNIVLNPVECQQCQKWMCEVCVKKWMQVGGQTCPNCRQNFVKTPKLHHYLRNKLDQYIFQCTKCIQFKKPDAEREMSYSQFSDHIQKKCPVICIQCPFLCDPLRYFTKEELNNHLMMGQCPNDTQICPKGCGYEILNREIIQRTHNCLQHLKNIIMEKNIQIEQLEFENNQLRENAGQNGQFLNNHNVIQQPQRSLIQSNQVQQQNQIFFRSDQQNQIGENQMRQLQNQKNQNLQNNEIQGNLEEQVRNQIYTCYKGHQLKKFYVRDHLQEINCEICPRNENIQNNNFYWGCNEQDCGFFICDQCKYI